MSEEINTVQEIVKSSEPPLPEPKPQSEKITELTNEQKKQILQRINDTSREPPGIKELTILCFGGSFDGRDRRAKLIKEYCATLQFIPRSTFEYKKVEIPPLTEEQKQFCANHAATMTSTEIARELYDNPKITNLHKGAKQIRDYLNSLPNVLLYKKETDYNESEYRPPKTLNHAACRVNKYILNCIKPEDVETNTKLKENLYSLIKYCHVHRFLTIMNGFESNSDRDLFESCYIRYLHDKGEELAEEEIDAYLNLCLDIVNHSKLQREIDKLSGLRDQQTEDSEGKKMSMSIVEMMGKVYQEMNENQKRQTKLLENLQGKRSERIKNKIKENQSVLQLVDAWRDKQRRERLIKIAENKKKILKEELNRLETLDSVLAEIWGLNKESFE